MLRPQVAADPGGGQNSQQAPPGMQQLILSPQDAARLALNPQGQLQFAMAAPVHSLQHLAGLPAELQMQLTGGHIPHLPVAQLPSLQQNEAMLHQSQQPPQPQQHINLAGLRLPLESGAEVYPGYWSQVALRHQLGVPGGPAGVPVQPAGILLPQGLMALPGHGPVNVIGHPGLGLAAPSPVSGAPPGHHHHHHHTSVPAAGGAAAPAAGGGGGGGGGGSAMPQRSGDSRSGSAYATRHQAAEQRRRLRINERLDGLRKLVPHAERANTACFLEEVIKYINQLRERVEKLEGTLGVAMSALQAPGGAADVAVLSQIQAVLPTPAALAAAQPTVSQPGPDSSYPQLPGLPSELRTSTPVPPSFHSPLPLQSAPATSGLPAAVPTTSAATVSAGPPQHPATAAYAQLQYQQQQQQSPALPPLVKHNSSTSPSPRALIENGNGLAVLGSDAQPTTSSNGAALPTSSAGGGGGASRQQVAAEIAHLLHNKPPALAAAAAAAAAAGDADVLSSSKDTRSHVALPATPTGSHQMGSMVVEGGVARHQNHQQFPGHRNSINDGNGSMATVHDQLPPPPPKYDAAREESAPASAYARQQEHSPSVVNVQAPSPQVDGSAPMDTMPAAQASAPAPAPSPVPAAAQPAAAPAPTSAPAPTTTAPLMLPALTPEQLQLLLAQAMQMQQQTMMAAQAAAAAVTSTHPAAAAAPAAAVPASVSGSEDSETPAAKRHKISP